MKLLALTFLAAALSLAQHKIEYRVLEASNPADIEAGLSQAASEGFRFVAVDFRSASIKSPQITVFLEKSHGIAADRVQYKVVKRRRLPKLRADLAEAGEQGWSIVGLSSLDINHPSEFVVVLRRPEALEAR